MRWEEALAQHPPPLLLPAAHDVLTARLIARAGFPAFQVGGFALAGSRLGLPDLGLADFGDELPLVRDILGAVPLPALVDCDDGGDHLKIRRVVAAYADAGAAALFVEDQARPKRCGHMGGKKVVPAGEMVKKLRAAHDAAQGRGVFLLARTDAYAVDGLDGTLKRGEAYLKKGKADGLYFEGISTEEDLRRAAEAFRGVPLATSVLEGHGKTPWRLGNGRQGVNLPHLHWGSSPACWLR